MAFGCRSPFRASPFALSAVPLNCCNKLIQVVACFLVRGVECRISVRVLCLVLLFEAGHHWLRFNLGLLRLHVRYRAHVLLADGQQRLFRVLLVSATYMPTIQE